jgi:hypothetical protein
MREWPWCADQGREGRGTHRPTIMWRRTNDVIGICLVCITPEAIDRKKKPPASTRGFRQMARGLDGMGEMPRTGKASD